MGYHIDTMPIGNSYYSTVTPYSNPYQDLANAFASLGDTLHNRAIKEKFVENCMITRGWRKVEKDKLAVTVSAYALVGQKNTVYEGSATGFPDGTGTLKMKSKEGHVCGGHFRYTDSVGGSGLVRCDDGASAKFTFKAITTLSGYGSGKSNQNELVRFVYGLDGEKRDKYLNLLK